jgi:hypothetical protein
MADNRTDPVESATARQSAQQQTRESFNQGVIDFNRRLEDDMDADFRQELVSIFQGLSQMTPMRDRIIEGTGRVPANTTLNTVSTTTSSNKKRHRVESGGLQPMGATSFTQLYASRSDTVLVESSNIDRYLKYQELRRRKTTQGTGHH